MALAPGWRRQPDAPHHAIEHESKRLRISKALARDRFLFTVWLLDNGEWIRPKIPHQTDIAAAIRKAEKLI